MVMLEYIGTALGFLCIYGLIRQKLFSWPAGIISTTIYVYIFFEAKLYSDVLLHIAYIISQAHGWYYWLQGKRDELMPANIQRLSSREGAIWLAIACVGIYALGLTMSTFTDASLPYFDAGTTVVSLIAQWLMTRKYLENWLIWVCVDVVAAAIYAYKALYPMSLLYLTYGMMGIFGFLAWRKALISDSSIATQSA